MSAAAPLIAKARRALKQGDFAAFETQFLQAMELEPLNVAGWLELGDGYIQVAKPQGALMAAQAAAQAQGNNPKPYQLMARAFELAGDMGKMIAALDKADKVAPSTETAMALGQKYLALDLPGRSLPYWERLCRAEPQNKSFRLQFALCCLKAGRQADAAAILQDMILADPKNDQLALYYGTAMRSVQFNAPDMNGYKAIALLLERDDFNHQLIAAPALSLLSVMPEFALLHADASQLPLDDALLALLNNRFFLLCLLQLKLRDDNLEQWLTIIRRRFLLEWQNHKLFGQCADFLAALGVACWFNDFVFAVTPDENAIDAKSVLLQSCYHQITKADDLQGLQGDYLAALLAAQITNPQKERDITADITSFTTVTDQTSQAVRDMYEARPYPSWRQPIAFNDKGVAGQTGKGLQLLVAGCGTGQEVMHFAANLPDITITAIDLSMASIGYAARQAQAYKVDSRVTFKQGDLLQIADLGQSFDVVTSTGVLHHLKEPETGLKALLSVLREGGRMHLALYAHKARDHYLQSAIDLAAEMGITQDANGMRQFRQHILQLPTDHAARRCVELLDFYTLNECTDLLFHVQECWYTLPQLHDLLDKNGLELVTFKLPPVRRGAYLQANPQDRAHVDWQALIAFEAASPPDTFIGMYDFWVKRKGDEKSHPLDAAIMRQML